MSEKTILDVYDKPAQAATVAASEILTDPLTEQVQEIFNLWEKPKVEPE